jgi:hypothetical protein
VTVTENKEHERYVVCDRVGCETKFFTTASTGPALLTLLEGQGWETVFDQQVRRPVHFCPEHRMIDGDAEFHALGAYPERVSDPVFRIGFGHGFRDGAEWGRHYPEQVKWKSAPMETGDAVNHPKHYNAGKFEVIDVIDDWKLGFSLGNAIKYIARAAHKGTELVDLQKAKWYLEHRIKQLEAEQNK